MTARVWTAAQYVDELRRRRDEARTDAQNTRDHEYACQCMDRATVYEECAALAELTADPQARGPVLDALAALHTAARVFGESLRKDDPDVSINTACLGEDVAEAADAVDAALDARRALPETVTLGEAREEAVCDPRWYAYPADEELEREIRTCLGCRCLGLKHHPKCPKWVMCL